MQNINIVQITVVAKAGAEISKCLLEGIELAAKENKLVALTHNEKEYIINPVSLLSVIKETL